MPRHHTNIFRATEQHLPALWSLSISTFTDAFGPSNKKEDMDLYVAGQMSLQKLATEMADPNNHFFLAELDNELAGYVKLRMNSSLPELNDTSPIEIERLYAQSKFHGQKVGAGLMDYSINFAIQAGRNVVWLGVWEHNHKAIRFYEKWGFETFSSHPFVLGRDVQTDILMKKDLRQIHK